MKVKLSKILSFKLKKEKENYQYLVWEVRFYVIMLGVFYVIGFDFILSCQAYFM